MFYETRLQRRTLILTSLTHFVNDGVSMVPLSIFPLLLTMFGLSAPELGVVAAMWNVTSVFGSPVVGHLSDRLKRNRALLAAGVVMMGVGIVGIGWSVTSGAVRSWLPLNVYPALVLFAAIGGFGASVAHPIGGTVLSQAYPASKIGKALGLNGALGSLGRTLYPSFVVILITALNLPYGVIALGLLGLLPAALIGLFPFESARDKASHIWPKDDPLNSAKSPDLHRTPRKIPSLGRSAKTSLLVLTTIGVLRGAFTQGVVSFLSVFIVQVQQYSFIFGVGVIMVISLVLSVPAQIIFGHLSDLHRRGALVVNNAGQSLAIIFYLLTLSNPVVATICLALFGFFTYSNYPVFISVVTDAVPADLLSLSSSIVWGIGILGGSAIGPVIVGLVVGSTLSLLPAIFLVLAVISGLATGLVALLPRRSEQLVSRSK
ncbi:MFS transporter [[Eubacterium] cellulosolvens]